MLDAVAWGYTAATFDALGHTFALRATDAEAGRYLGRAFGALRAGGPAGRAGGPAGTVYSLLDCGPPPEPYLLYADDRLVMRHEAPAVLASHLTWEVNRRAIAAASGAVCLHAAAAEHDGAGVVLAGAMEAGKTTLVAGLVRSGLRYLSDEAAVVEPETLALRAYPKPLSVDRGSWSLLADLEPSVPARVRPWMRAQWQVAPDDIRPGAVAEGAVPRAVVTVRYVPRAATALEPVAPSRQLLALAPLVFSFGAAPRRNLAVLAALIDRCACFHLTVGDLTAACALVRRALVETGRRADADRPLRAAGRRSP